MSNGDTPASDWAFWLPGWGGVPGQGSPSGTNQGPILPTVGASDVLMGWADDDDKTQEALAAKGLIKIYHDRFLPFEAPIKAILADPDVTRVSANQTQINVANAYIRSTYLWTNEANKITQTNAKTVWIDRLGGLMDQAVYYRTQLIDRKFTLKDPLAAGFKAGWDSLVADLEAWKKLFEKLLGAVASNMTWILIAVIVVGLVILSPTIGRFAPSRG